MESPLSLVEVEEGGERYLYLSVGVALEGTRDWVKASSYQVESPLSLVGVEEARVERYLYLSVGVAFEASDVDWVS